MSEHRVVAAGFVHSGYRWMVCCCGTWFQENDRSWADHTIEKQFSDHVMKALTR